MTALGDWGGFFYSREWEREHFIGGYYYGYGFLVMIF